MIFFANQLIGIHMVRASTKRSSWKSFRFWMGIKPFNMTLFLFFFPDFTLSIASYVSRVNLQPFRYNVFSVSSDEVMVINKFSRWWNSQYLFSSVKNYISKYIKWKEVFLCQGRKCSVFWQYHCFFLPFLSLPIFTRSI